VREVIYVVLACVLRATTKKRSSTFWKRKVHPRSEQEQEQEEKQESIKSE